MKAGDVRLNNQIHEDPKRLQQFYERIGTLLISLMPDTWDLVVMGYFLEGEDRVPHQQILYDAAGNGDYIDLMEQTWDNEDLEEGVLDLGDTCARMQEYCRSCGDDWQSMTIRLQPDGNFSVQYDYNAIDFYDTRYIQDWQSRSLD